MNYLLVEKLTKSYGIKYLFQNITFGLQKGQKVALIARNGSGKTSLLKIIAGKDVADEGKVVIRNGITIGYLEQAPEFDPHKTILETIFNDDNPLMKVIREYERTVQLYETDKSDSAYQQMSNSMQQMDRLQAWDLESKVKQILSKLKLDNIESKMGALSGGQLKRVSLAMVLINQPDLLILDEPTNHLDIDMIEWLEDYLTAPGITLLMVTHDRYFLDNVCSDIYELDNGAIYQYEGNYSYFLQKKAERESIHLSEVDKARNLYFRELEWVRKMPKARGTKSKSRVDAFDEIKEKAFQIRKQKEIDINMRMKRMGNKILEVIKVSKSYEEKNLIEKFTYSFRKGERIGIAGNNGTGKSTFLKMITQQLSPDEGKVIVGDTIEFGYYGQQGITLSEDKRVIEIIKEIAEVIDVDKSASITASQMLTRFDFPPEMQYTFVSKLSGGEKRRLYLLTVLLRNPNFLILDEPTNDLDILTLNKLEEYLESFEGCIIVVSHDRYFMDKIIDQCFVFKGNGEVEIFGGTYSEYRIKEEEKEKVSQKIEKNLNIVSENKTKKKWSFKEKNEFENIEKQLPILEKEKLELEEKISSGIADHNELIQITDRLSLVMKAIDEKTERWLILTEMMEE
jgi:ATP-binding cassette subfamily F protein uup